MSDDRERDIFITIQEQINWSGAGIATPDAGEKGGHLSMSQ